MITDDKAPMHLPEHLHTARLLLRRWRAADRAPFAALNADPVVMEHLPAALSRDESDAFAERIERHFAERGFGLWAVEPVGEAPFAGYVGLSVPRFQPPFAHRAEPLVEIAWRLDARHWHRGFATEAARACVAFAFEHLGLDELVSFTVPRNLRSRRVMERLGMRADPADDFEHPLLPEGHPLRRHVLYRLARPV